MFYFRFLLVFNDFYYIQGFSISYNTHILFIGIIEEFCKIFPVLIVLSLKTIKIKEPIQVLVFSSVSALVFASLENIIKFDIYSIEILSHRGILCILGHISFTIFPFYFYWIANNKRLFFHLFYFFF